MKIQKKVFEEVSKLSKDQWDALKVGVDYLFASELKEQEKTLFLGSEAEEKLKYSPRPILLVSE